jgi:hypothetical protein
MCRSLRCAFNATDRAPRLRPLRRAPARCTAGASRRRDYGGLRITGPSRQDAARQPPQWINIATFDLLFRSPEREGNALNG